MVNTIFRVNDEFHYVVQGTGQNCVKELRTHLREVGIYNPQIVLVNFKGAKSGNIYSPILESSKRNR